MTYLNEIVPINMKALKKLIIEKIEDEIENQLYLLDIIFPDLKKYIEDNKKIYNEKINRIKNNISKNVRNIISSDHFCYMVMDDNRCTYKHNRGSNDGKFCCKNITKKGNKKNFVCRIHNKYHIPEKKIKPCNDKSLETFENLNKNNIQAVNTSCISNDEISLENKKINTEPLENMIPNNIKIKNNNDIDKIKVKKNSKNYKNSKNFIKNKIYIGNSGSFMFSNIIEKYTNLLLKQNIFNITLFAERNFYKK